MMNENKKKELKKYGAYAIFVGVFLLVMYMLFGEYVDKNGSSPGTGINTAVPEGKEKEIIDSKIDNYEDRSIHLSEDENGSFNRKLEQEISNIAPMTHAENSALVGSSSAEDAAIKALESTTAALNSYQEDDQKELELEYYRQQLEALRDSMDEQSFDMKEKDSKLEYYQTLMNMRMNGQPIPESPEEQAEREHREKADALRKRMENRGASMEAAGQVRERVSSLSGSSADVYDRIEEIRSGKRNAGFISAHKQNTAMADKNTLKVYVARNTVVKHGDFVRLMTLEQARIDDRILLPARTPIVAKAVLEGTRMNLIVNSIIYKEEIIKIKLSAFDLNGQEGIYVPGSDELDTAKEVGQDMAQSMGNSYNFNSSAKDQILTEAAKGVMKGVSKLFTRKLKNTKVLLKSGFEMYLYQTPI